jgi:DNA gyrase subunit A
MKVWQLPLATPQSRGKALVNLLPLGEKENISVYMRLPEDEDVWSELDIIFATSAGGIRRNKLSDFGNIRSNGLIAMKLEGDERLVSVKIAREDEDVMLTTKLGKAIRFELNDVRVFAGRTSTGVRGIKLGKGDEVISMSTLRHVDATPEERTAYLKKASQLRGMDMEGVEFEDGDVAMAEDRFKELQNKEQFLITVTNKGYGKRTSAYEYRLTGRGGQGVTNMGLTSKNGGEVVATFPVTDDHQVMLVTDAGQLIRTPVKDVRFTGRSAQGVIVFRVGESESVISVAWLIQEDEDETLEQGDDTAQLTESDAPSLPAEE